VAHFEQTVSEEDSYLSPVSQGLLQEYADDIRSQDASRWVGAAMRLEKELDADFKFNLAAFRQSVLTNVRELQPLHWTRLLRPSVASLLSVRDDGYQLVKARSAFESAVQRMVEESQTLPELLTKYERRLGHLPLHPELSAGAVVGRWLVGHPDEISWPRLCEWEQEAPLMPWRLHAIQIVLANPSLLTEDEHELFWDKLVALLQPDREGKAPSPLVTALALEADLARHYFQYLESRTVGMDVDRLATVAWWAASTVTNVVAEHAARAADPTAFLEQIRQGSLGPELEKSCSTWQMIHPCSGGSTIRFATMFVRQPRILGLMLAFEDRIDKLLIKALSLEHRKIVTAEFVEYLLGCFPLGSKAAEQAIWAFDSPFLTTFKQWVGIALDKRALAEHQEPIALAKALDDADQRHNALKDLSVIDDPARTHVAHLFHVLACTSDADADRLWRLAVDKDWREGCFQRLGPAALQALFSGMIELRYRVKDARDAEISHWFAEGVEASEQDAGRRSLFFGLTIVASAITGTVSAIRRLVGGPPKGVLVKDISYWQTEAEVMLPLAPPVLAARLRDILSSLRGI